MEGRSPGCLIGHSSAQTVHQGAAGRGVPGEACITSRRGPSGAAAWATRPRLFFVTHLDCS